MAVSLAIIIANRKDDLTQNEISTLETYLRADVYGSHAHCTLEQREWLGYSRDKTLSALVKSPYVS